VEDLLHKSKLDPAADSARGLRLGRIGLLLGGALFAPAVFAQDALDSGDTAWMLVATVLVLFMTIPGLSLFYAGMVRSKNVLSVLMQCFAITCLVTVLWVFWGYSIAFGGDGPYWGGLSKAFLAGVTADSVSGTIPETVFLTFQMTFAIITPALIVGAFVDRMKFSALMVFVGIWVLVVYAPITHWVWGSGGWLGARGILDFAGGTVVHVNSGIAGLVAAIVVGKRVGLGKDVLAPHNLTYSVVGAALLWVGWFGFNGGSALAANGDAAMAMLVTHISASAAAFTWMCAEWIRFGKPSALGAVTGMVAGLGCITAASGYVGPAGALVIGILAGAICFLATNYLKRTLKIDDSLDVFPVHGVGGILGTLLTGVFASNALGIFSGQEDIVIADQLGIQAIGVIAVVGYTAIVTFLILLVTNALVGNRVSDDEEIEGLDLVLHNERGYDI